MIPAGFDYLRPGTIAEALEMASRHQDATFLAGGHALLPEWKLSRTGPATLIDLGRIGELHGIEVFGDGSAPEAGGRPGEMVRIGAMTTSAEIEYSTDIARAAPLLPQAAAVISDPLIRNRATLGGSLAEASPSGDWPAVVLAADATILLRSRDSERAVPAGDFFSTDGAGFSGKATTLRRGELLTAVTVPAASPLARSTYLKRMHPASGHAMIGVAVTAAFDTSRTGSPLLASAPSLPGRSEPKNTCWARALPQTSSKALRTWQPTGSPSPATRSAPPPTWPN
jgi:aerobic carbon-monoxide dehydrogenase medium subunit